MYARRDFVLLHQGEVAFRALWAANRCLSLSLSVCVPSFDLWIHFVYVSRSARAPHCAADLSHTQGAAEAGGTKEEASEFIPPGYIFRVSPVIGGRCDDGDVILDGCVISTS